MTKKETIALRYYTALTEKTGKSFTDADVTYLACHRSAAWLEEKAAEAEKLLAIHRAEVAKKEYLESEEGKAGLEKAGLLANIYYDEVHEAQAAASQVATDYVKGIFGENAMVRIQSNGAEVGIRDTESKYPDTFKFGHSFHIYYEKKWSWNRETNKSEWKPAEAEINFGTMGSYKPGKDIEYCNYVKMISEFSNNAELMSVVTSLITDFNKYEETMRPKFKAIEDWRKDPLNNPKPWVEFEKAA